MSLWFVELWRHRATDSGIAEKKDNNLTNNNNNDNTKSLKCKQEKKDVYRKAVDYYKKKTILSVFIFSSSIDYF